MKIVTKRVPLFQNSAMKDTRISDLLRSELRSKKAPFSENCHTHMLTHIVKVIPRGF